MRHLDDASLLELRYVPDGNHEYATHVAECSSCAERFEALRKAINTSVSIARGADQSDAFWRRQRGAIMSRIDQPSPKFWSLPSFRFAAAAILVLITGGSIFVVGRRNVDPRPPVAVVSTAALSPVAAGLPEVEVVQVETAIDPWGSGELSDFRGVVDWESWEHPAGSGGTL